MSLGIGAMLGFLGGNEETVNAIQKGIGQKVIDMRINDERLFIMFESNDYLIIKDDGQSCCEHRYMQTDDDLKSYVGEVLKGVQLKDAPDQVDEDGEVHQIQFLEIITDKSVVSISNHNEHNGYYGGFDIVASYHPSDPTTLGNP